MKPHLHNLILLIALIIGGLNLAFWWSNQLQSLNTPNRKTQPPAIPNLPNLNLASSIVGNQTHERPLFWESRRPLPSETKSSATIITPFELLGVVSEGSQRVALLRPLKGEPPVLVHRLHVGESYNGVTLQAIDTDQVTLKNANGVETLHLKRGSQNPNFSNQPAKLSAPQTIEATRSKLPDALQKRTDELKAKAALQAQQPSAAP